MYGFFHAKRFVYRFTEVPISTRSVMKLPALNYLEFHIHDKKEFLRIISFESVEKDCPST